MKFAKSFAHGFIGIIILLLIIAIGFNLIDDKCSKILDNVDLTWEEVQAYK